MAWEYEYITKNNTKIKTTEDGLTVVILHQTPIVAFNNEYIYLNTGGHWSVTTKKRMNQVSQQFNLGFAVYQRDYEWFIDTPTDYGIHFVNEKIALKRGRW